MTKDATGGGGGLGKKTQIVKKSHSLYVPYRTRIPYRILKTRANDDISDIRPKKHGPRAEIYSGGTVDQKIV